MSANEGRRFRNRLPLFVANSPLESKDLGGGKKKERETVKPRVAFEVELAGFARDKEGSEGRRGRIDNVPGLLPFRPGGG